MSNVLKIAAAGGVTEETDEHFENTVLLLHGDGNQGATNFSNTGSPSYLAFKDNSTNNFPITVNGDAYGDNFGPYAVPEGNWSNYFDGSGDYLALPSSSNLTLDGDFTIECFAYYNADVANGTIFGTGGSPNWTLQRRDASNQLAFYDGTWHLFLATVPLNTWFHIAMVRSGSTITGYIDGVSVTSWTQASNINLSGGYICGQNGSAYPINGFISNFRVVKGTAIIPSSGGPTSPLTAVTNTSLLTCQSNRFVDNSTNNFAITRNGDVKVQVFNPFGVLPDGVNGSGYFDGSGDNLTLASNAALEFGSGAYTVEFWINPGALSGTSSHVIGSNTTGGFLVYVSNAKIALNNFGVGDVIAYNTPPALNAWTHIAFVREGTGANQAKIYVNGVAQATGTDSNNWSTSTNFIIASNASGGQYLTGFLSGIRIVKGSAVYTSAFTPPTSALTAVTNTSLLTCQYAGSMRNVGFIDSGPYDFPITRVGNTTQGTFSPFSKPDGRWGNYFDGSGDTLTLASDTAFAMGTGDFTIEFWFYSPAISGSGYIVQTGSAGTNTLYVSLASSTIRLTNQPTAFATTPTLSSNTWYHIAVQRSGTSSVIYTNGVAGTPVACTIDFAQAGFIVGANNYGGYISNLRIVKGTAVYTSNFTPSTTPLTAIINTSLLTCQSNRFIDNSSNAFAITRNGDVKVTPFSPFPITTAYSPTVNGGAGYFDGSGDYLTAASNAAFGYGTGDFTIEGWHYLTAASSSTKYLFDQRVSGATLVAPAIYIDSGAYVVYINGGAPLNAGTVVANSWIHWALVKYSGTTKLYINGTSVGSFADSNNYVTSQFRVGSEWSASGSYDWQGYLSVRVVKGTAVYTSNFTPPTAPLTAVSGTSLLLNFTNAGILDNTGFNALETVGNAQIDTSVVKYGTGSMEFDGSGDYLTVSGSADSFAFGTGDFTIEFWTYVNSFSTNPVFYDSRPAGTNGAYVMIYAASTGVMRLFVSTGDRITSSALSTSTWYHIAICRSGTSTKMFVNGVQEGSTYTDSNNYLNPTGRPWIGINASTTNTSPLNGFIDELRITKGIARYTTTFTPPDKSLPDIGE